MDSGKPTLSIITATYNAVEMLPHLLASLRAQTDLDFEWVVMDAASTDGTVAILDGVSDLHLVYRSEPDFGIYDALNKAIKLCSGEYYLVIGADDLLYPDAVANYKLWALQSGADIITASIAYGAVVKTPAAGCSWLRGGMAFVTSHAVGSIYKKTLHVQQGIGFYSQFYPIAADQLFILRAIKHGGSICVADFCAGRFGDEGISSTDSLGTLTEFFRIQMQFEWRPLQILLFMLRLIKHSPRLMRS
ncbi:glycosyltransferase [Methylobacillus methanolivorans]|uniref:Glycosyltransferase n=1 Tax=Methylobacillus methanolivorans TaxID=1848927 RepID=A0ABW8GI41_9PROT